MIVFVAVLLLLTLLGYYITLKVSGDRTLAFIFACVVLAIGFLKAAVQGI